MCILYMCIYIYPKPQDSRSKSMVKYQSLRPHPWHPRNPDRLLDPDPVKNWAHTAQADLIDHLIRLAMVYLGCWPRNVT